MMMVMPVSMRITTMVTMGIMIIITTTRLLSAVITISTYG